MDYLMETIQMIEWKSILLVLAILALDIFILKVIEKGSNLHPELKRKLFHVSMGIVMLTFPFIFTNFVSVAILGVFGLMAMIALKNTKLKDTAGTILYSVDRESFGEIFFIFSVVIIFYWAHGDKILYSIPILILTFADSAAALIGKRYAKTNLAQYNEDTKSLEGSFTFFVVAFMATHVPLLLFTNTGREECLLIATIVGFNVALIEMISHGGNDNLLIPLTAFAFVSTHISYSVDKLRMNLLLIAIIYVLVLIADKVKAFSKLAIVEAIVIGYLTITLYGIYALIIPFIMIMTIMRFPKRRECEKDNTYDMRIVETNVLVPIAICAVACIIHLKEQLFMTYVTTYAMAMIVNSYVRFKYYIKMSEMQSFIWALAKGIVFIFIPGLIINWYQFGNNIAYYKLIAMVMSMILSDALIYHKKKNVENEEILISNGYMHMKIVMLFTIILSGIELAEYFL